MKEKKVKKVKEPKVIHALIVFAVLIAAMGAGILIFDAGVHISMFIGVCAAAIMALYLGFDWQFIEDSMIEGIKNSLQAVIILIIVGILIGVWILTGVVPAMIYYGLKLLSPAIFLIAATLICSVTSISTGTSWGTVGTMGLALIGIAVGLGIPAPLAAGAILSGAYFGDKMSPLSDTTNLAAAMAGTDVFTHVKFMMKPTMITYVISLVIYGILGMKYSTNVGADVSQVQIMSDGISSMFNINPLLLLPPVIVVAAVAMKISAIPGITLGIFAGVLVGVIFQDGITFGEILNVGMDGYTCESGIEALDNLLSCGGIDNMMFSISLTIIAMMFGGIMERTGMLGVVVNKIVGFAKKPVSLLVATEATCILSNVVMPEQYISIVVPGRMYAKTYRDMKLHPKTLSNALESSGTVSSVLVPWNTCGVYMAGVLGVTTAQYLPYCFFNLLMPVMTVILAVVGGITLAKLDD